MAECWREFTAQTTGDLSRSGKQQQQQQRRRRQKRKQQKYGKEVPRRVQCWVEREPVIQVSIILWYNNNLTRNKSHCPTRTGCRYLANAKPRGTSATFPEMRKQMIEHA